MTIAVSPADPRSLKALGVLADSELWHKGHLKNGRKFFAIPSSSKPDVVYWTDGRECTCPDFTYRQADCKHRLAARLRLVELGGAEPPVPCDICGKAHSSDQERRRAHVAEYDAIWGGEQ